MQTVLYLRDPLLMAEATNLATTHWSAFVGEAYMARFVFLYVGLLFELKDDGRFLGAVKEGRAEY
jgi:hypothetical protein